MYYYWLAWRLEEVYYIWVINLFLFVLLSFSEKKIPFAKFHSMKFFFLQTSKMLRRIKIDAKFYFLMIQLLLLLLLLYYYEDVLPLICIMSYCNASIILTRNITDFSIMMNHGKFFIYCFPTLIRWRRKEREREKKRKMFRMKTEGKDGTKEEENKNTFTRWMWNVIIIYGIVF